MGKLFDTVMELERLFTIPDTDSVVDTETGEIFNLEYLEGLKLEANELTKYLAQEVLNLDADAKAYKEQKDVFAKKQKTAENRRDSLKQYLSTCLDGSPFEADDKTVKISFRKSESVNIIALENVPDEYKTEEITIKANKTAIKKAIKDFGAVAGCELVESNNIQIK